MGQMFCFQCEQTAGGKSCSGSRGVCGKEASTANLQDKLSAALVGLALAAEKNRPARSTHKVMLEGLFTTITNANFDDKAVQAQTERVHNETLKLGETINTDVYDMDRLWTSDENIRSLKTLVLLGLRGTAAYAYHAFVLNYTDEEAMAFFYKGMSAIKKDLSQDVLLSLVLEMGKINLTYMELLDKANTETYGSPIPVKVSLSIEKGPFIVISGHDLHDLHQLLEQTKNQGVNIYTHGEMLPAHGYPHLKAYPQLKGNYGTAWQNQQKEFDGIPAPILFTTNCIMAPKPTYKDRVFTTAVVGFPDLTHIADIKGKKDFSPIIKQALELGGYSEDRVLTGINGGMAVSTGFGHKAVLKEADTIIKALKDGTLKHIFLVGGCDGAKMGRNYYTEFVKKTEKDSLILTLACGKYRFNDLDLGTFAGLPRILDMGQCNDAFGAIQVAAALAKVFNCSINELPLSFVLSWYEQKAVCVLLSLLYLGVENILLGPSLPAFISPAIFKFLVERFRIGAIGDSGEDLKKLLNRIKK